MTEPTEPQGTTPAAPTDVSAPVVGWVAPPPDSPASPAGPAPFRSASTRATVLLVLLGLNLAASVVAAFIALSGKSAIAAFEAGDAGIEALEAFDDSFTTFGLVETVVFVAAAVAWLAWQSRTVDNEDALGIGPSTITPRWSMGWWFVPFANLVMPYRAHREIHQRYNGGLVVGGGLVLAWWLAWIANNIASTVVGRIWTAAETFEELQSTLTMWIVTEGLTVIAAGLAFVLVRGIQRRADALASSGPTDDAIPTDPAPELVPDERATA